MQYQQKLDEIIGSLQQPASVLLHSCCAVCSSYVLEYLSAHFLVTVLYYNPNIYPDTEYRKRKTEQIRLIRETSYPFPVAFIDADAEYSVFLAAADGLCAAPEGGLRCEACFRLRLTETARRAAGRFDFFGTTLTVSPHKNAQTINAIGEALGAHYGVSWLYSDFKKKNGYLRATQLARQYGLYRQNYCGCEFSMRGEGE